MQSHLITIINENNESRKKHHNDGWIRTNPFPRCSSPEYLDEYKRTDRFVGIIYPTLRANIKAIYKSGILDECEVQRCIKLSNGISIDVYALPMIVALSFRLNTLGAYKTREYVMDKLTTNQRSGILFLNVRTHECMNESKYGLN